MSRSIMILIFIFTSLIPGWTQNQVSETLDVVSFGQRVQARVDQGFLKWVYPSGSGTLGSEGRIDWKGVNLTDLRSLKSLVLPSGEKGLAVVASDTSHTQGVYLLKEVWGGLEIWDGNPWISAASGETILGYEIFESEKGSLTGWLWTTEGITTKTFVSGSYILDKADLDPNTGVILHTYRDSGGEGAQWTFIAALRSDQGWKPLVWTFSRGELEARGPQLTSALSPQALDVNIIFNRPGNGGSGVLLQTGQEAALWTWTGTTPEDMKILSLGGDPQGWWTGSVGEKALFIWAVPEGFSGVVTDSLGIATLRDWNVALPGDKVFVSDLLSQENGFRIWTVLKNDTISTLWRVDISTQSFVTYEKAGDLPKETKHISFKLTQGDWILTDLDTQKTWKLDQKTLQLIAQSNPYDLESPWLGEGQ